VTIDLDKQQVRLRPKEGQTFQLAEFEKAFKDNGFSKVDLLASPKKG
jgi:3-isopropylmalate dehydratase small subunit